LISTSSFTPSIRYLFKSCILYNYCRGGRAAGPDWWVRPRYRPSCRPTLRPAGASGSTVTCIITGLSQEYQHNTNYVRFKNLLLSYVNKEYSMRLVASKLEKYSIYIEEFFVNILWTRSWVYPSWSGVSPGLTHVWSWISPQWNVNELLLKAV
jgi:hypothetical protein